MSDQPKSEPREWTLMNEKGYDPQSLVQIAVGPCVKRNDKVRVIEATPETLHAREMREALEYCKGTLEQLLGDHTKNGAWKAAASVLAKVRAGGGGSNG